MWTLASQDIKPFVLPYTLSYVDQPSHNTVCIIDRDMFSMTSSLSIPYTCLPRVQLTYVLIVLYIPLIPEIRNKKLLRILRKILSAFFQTLWRTMPTLNSHGLRSLSTALALRSVGFNLRRLRLRLPPGQINVELIKPAFSQLVFQAFHLFHRIRSQSS